MTESDQLRRTTDACRRAGLPVVEATHCTCGLRGRLVVLDGPDGLQVLWPYDGRCLVHGPTGPRRASASRPTAAGPIPLPARAGGAGRRETGAR